MLKEAKIDARISSGGESMQNLDLVLKSQDINNNAIELSFGDLELDDTFDVTILSIFSKSESQTTNRALIKDGKAYFKFDTSLIKQDERIYNYVYINQVDKTADVISFSFRVALSEIDKGALPVAEVYDFRYEEVIEDFETKLNAYIELLPDIIGHIEEEIGIDLTAYALKTDLDAYALKEDIPVIDLTGYATEVYVDNKVDSIEIPEVDLSGYAEKTELEDYAKKTEIPNVDGFITLDDVPEVDLTGLASEEYVDGKVASIPEPDLSDYAKKIEIPDTSGFITMDDLPEDKDTVYDDSELREMINAKPDVEFVTEAEFEAITDPDLNTFYVLLKGGN